MLDTLDFPELMSMSPRDALVKIITHNNEVYAKPDFLALGTPRALTGRITEVTVKGSSTIDPFIKQMYLGDFVFTYKRIDFAELFANTDITIQIDLPCKTSDVMAVLTHHYGYVFDSSDYINEAITALNAYDYILKAAPYSYRWYGQVRLTLLKKLDLSTITTVTDLGDLITNVAPRELLTLAKPYTDGRAYGKWLKDLPLGRVDTEGRMGGVLQRLYYQLDEPNLPFTFSDTPSERNLKGARVVFNGRGIDSHIRPYLFTLSRVVVIELDDSLNTVYRGRLVIHYNARLNTEQTLFPEGGYRYPGELLAGVLNGTAELSHFGTLYEGELLEDSTLDVSFMDRILNVPAGTVKCSPTPANYNLYGAKVEYLGRNVGYPESFDRSLNQVWVVRLDPEYSNLVGGRLLIYYKR